MRSLDRDCPAQGLLVFLSYDILFAVVKSTRSFLINFFLPPFQACESEPTTCFSLCYARADAEYS